MDKYMLESSAAYRDASESPPLAAANPLRLASQIVGFLLILIGAGYSLFVIVAALGFAGDPNRLTVPLNAMDKALGLENVTIPSGPTNVPVGRTVSCVILIYLYLATARVAMQLVGVGSAMVREAAAERREVLATMKEILASARSAGNGVQSREVAKRVGE